MDVAYNTRAVALTTTRLVALTMDVVTVPKLFVGRSSPRQEDGSKPSNTDFSFMEQARKRVRERLTARKNSKNDTCAPAPPTTEAAAEADATDGTGDTFARFRATARMVKNQMILAKGLVQDAEKHLKLYTMPTMDENESQILAFDLHSFYPEVQSCSDLSPRVKMILSKQAWSRTEEELSIVRRFVMKLSCFNRYSTYVRNELARVLYYDAFGRDRVVIRQGDMGFNFYFVISGSVLVKIKEKDPLTGNVHNTVVGELGPGSTFGELALLHDDMRRATIVCKENCEFLKVDKPDFNKILKENYKRDMELRRVIVERHHLFHGWSVQNTTFAVEGSQIVEYAANTVVLKDLSVMQEKVYILTKGKCQVVQKVYLIHSTSKRKSSPQKYCLPPVKNSYLQHNCYHLTQPSSEREGNKERVVKKWWVVRTLYPGDYFGIGEGPQDTSVVCLDMAECLLIDHVVFAKHSRGRGLEWMREEAERQYPSTDTALESYVQMKTWQDYKRSVVQEIVAKKQRKSQSYTLRMRK